MLTSVLAIAPGITWAAEPVCLTRTEATSLIAYALPQAISGTAKRCSAALPADAFLRRHGGELAARYAGQKDKYWPQAKPAFMKTLGANGGDASGLSRNLPDDSMRQLADVFVEGFVSQRIALKSCDKLDLAIDLLSPLPPENTAGLIALTMEVASNAEPKVGHITLCKG
ncbi:hypothetical protein [Novosphingobium sp. CF614]|uniref:hypothetical protein n=1 Tax=Novosphingobium sp. CF614 TaxID=1884364 RepID=UPI00210100A2|nr:hypothetical protein [Novosphingobium sp. CF614]